MIVPISPAPIPTHRIPLRVAVVQFCPKIGQVDVNLARARELCLKLERHSVDLLCFPEMAFTGYEFDSADAILPYLETPRTGPTSLFCKDLASHLSCYVAAGYPERLGDEETTAAPDEGGRESSGEDDNPSNDKTEMERIRQSSDTSEVKPPRYVGANSAIIYGPSGEWVGGYRKTNLFRTDMSWAKAGTGFASFTLPLSLSPNLPGSSDPSPPISTYSLDITLGICMDLNPQPPVAWTSGGPPYELADYCANNRSKVLVLLNAWLSPNSGQENEEEEEAGEVNEARLTDDDSDGDEPEWSTLNYWCARLRPLWRLDGRRRGSNETIYSDISEGEKEVDEKVVESGEEEEDKPPHETIVVICNRTGTEEGVTFAGSSAIFSMHAGSGRPKLLDVMGQREEGVRVWNLFI